MQVFQEKNYFIFNDAIFHIKNLEIKKKSVFLIIGCSKVEKKIGTTLLWIVPQINILNNNPNLY